MNKIQKIASGFGAFVASLALVTVSFGAELSTSTAPGLVNGLITDVATIIGAVVVAILGLLGALMGLGWGVKKFRAYITGKKF